MSNYESFGTQNLHYVKSKNSFFQRLFPKFGNKHRGKSPLSEQNDYYSSSISIANQVQSRSNFIDNNTIDPKESNIINELSYQQPQEQQFKERHNPHLVSYQQDMSLTKLIRAVKSNISFGLRGSLDHLDLNTKANKVYWMPDSICLNCYGCDDEFTTIKRKHHCRMCGQIFCYRCCSYELPGELWSLSKPQRSCRICFLSFYNNTNPNPTLGAAGTSTRGSTEAYVTSESKYYRNMGNNDNNNNNKNDFDHNDGDYETLKHKINEDLRDRERNKSFLRRPSLESVMTHVTSGSRLITNSRQLDCTPILEHSIGRGISLSSHNIHFLGQETGNCLEPTFPNEIQKLNTLNRTNSLPKLDNDDTLSSSRPSITEPVVGKKSDRKSSVPSRTKLSRVVMLPHHLIFHHLMKPESNLSTTMGSGSTSTLSQMPNLHKRHLLTVWKRIIDQTLQQQEHYTTVVRVQRQTRAMEEQFSFPSEQNNYGAVEDNFWNDCKTEDDNNNINTATAIDKSSKEAVAWCLPIVFKETEPCKACIDGQSLVNWILRMDNSDGIETNIVKDRIEARRICQSYLEMQLLTPYFSQDIGDVFKDDATLYIIREFTAEYSPGLPTLDQDNFFPDCSELKTQLSSSDQHKSTGNSIFYVGDIKTHHSTSTGVDSTSVGDIETSYLKIKTPVPVSLVTSTTTTGQSEACNTISTGNIFSAKMWMRCCEYLERLLQQELREYNLDQKWCNILLPVCKVISESIELHNRLDKSNNDIRKVVQIKKIPDSKEPDCLITHSIVMSKNMDLVPNKELRNVSILLIRSSIDYWKQKKLVSIEPLLLQEEEYLRNCIRKICKLRPDIVIVEGSVSLLAKDLMDRFGLVLISNVRREQMDRLSRILHASIIDSVDTLGANIEQKLGKCSQVINQQYRLTNGRTKNLVLFKLNSSKIGGAIILRGQRLSELVRVKYVLRFILLAFKNAIHEIWYFKDLQLKSLANKPVVNNVRTSHVNESKSVLLDVIRNKIISISVNIVYNPPPNVIRAIQNPALQDRLLALDVVNLSWKERINDVLKKKYRHFLAEMYDKVRMEIHKHPLLFLPEVHPFINCLQTSDTSNSKHRCSIYSDFRRRGGRFQPASPNDLKMSLMSSLDFHDSDLAVRAGFLTKNQELKWRTQEKKAFESIKDLFNPRNYQRILLLYSIHTMNGVCENPRKISLSYYESTDRSLGAFVSAMLNDFTSCPAKCEVSVFKHIYRFVHNTGLLQMSVLKMESDSMSVQSSSSSNSTNSNRYSDIRMWNWCSRCDKTLGSKIMSPETWSLSLGRFMDLMFNLCTDCTGLGPGQCNHSLQTDLRYYFAQNNNKALEIKYSPIQVYEFQTPDLFINIEPKCNTEEIKLEAFKSIRTDINKLKETKMRCNVEIKEKSYQLSKTTTVDDQELIDFLLQESNSEQYITTIETIYNVMDKIYNSKNEFDSKLFEIHENELKDGCIMLWQDIMKTLIKWDSKLNDAYEKEDKSDKRLSKPEAKGNLKASSENLSHDTELVSKSLTNQTLSTPDHFGSVYIKDSLSCVVSPKLLKNNSLDNNIDQYSHVSDQNLDMCLNQAWFSGSNDGNLKIAINLNIDIESDYKTSAEAPYDNLDDNIETVVTKKEKVVVCKDKEITDGKSNLQPLKKFFNSLFNSSGLKVLEDRSQPHESFIFQDIETLSVPVIVQDDSLTSVVAFVLSSNVYCELLSEMEINTKGHIDSSSNITSNTQSDKKKHDLSPLDTLAILNDYVNVDNELGEDFVDKSISKDSGKDITVHFLNHRDSDDQSDGENNELGLDDYKNKSEEIKFQLSNDEPQMSTTSADVNSSKTTSTVNRLNLQLASKKVVKNDIEINLTNHKVRCLCKVYYAPQFYELRRKMLKCDETEYIRSLAESKQWTTTGGRSGLKFRKTLDNRFIIKQMNQSELNGFRRFHEKYFEYISDKLAKKEKCVLAKIIGIYHVDYANSVTKFNDRMEFLVMENLFYQQSPVRIFDLKGKRHAATAAGMSSTGTATSAGAAGSSVSNNSNILNASINGTTTTGTGGSLSGANNNIINNNNSDNSVMQDKDFTTFIQSRPLYVSWQAQIALKDTISRDTNFLCQLPVMDYSLLVGVDETSGILTVGIIDYLRMFTVDKLIEMHIKKKLTVHGEQPTVIQPQKYQQRFQEAIVEQYFKVAPSPWDSLLLCPPSSK